MPFCYQNWFCHWTIKIVSLLFNMVEENKWEPSYFLCACSVDWFVSTFLKFFLIQLLGTVARNEEGDIGLCLPQLHVLQTDAILGTCLFSTSKLYIFRLWSVLQCYMLALQIKSIRLFRIGFHLTSHEHFWILKLVATLMWSIEKNSQFKQSCKIVLHIAKAILKSKMFRFIRVNSFFFIQPVYNRFFVYHVLVWTT